MRPDGRPSGSDSGSGTVWMLTLCMLIWFSASAVVVVAGVRTDRHRAATAADLAALSGARQVLNGKETPCAEAREVAEANNARLTECEVSGLTVYTEVRVTVRTWPGEVTARARAGPVGLGSPG
ncbi:Rv3654c family TadE-like protein [Allosalinactinospora lopnorensis]|uniref:Rv3654c family TadE-like protein n=1 Tax=Allosalinactinospora lopnorensis TaxID=1352348 RepID=UPI000697817D